MQKIDKIPVHDFSDRAMTEIRVMRLKERSDYDTSIPHRHNYFEFFVFDKGAGTHEIDFNKYEIETGSIHLVAPGQVHKVRRELNTSGYVILFNLSVFESNKMVTDFLFDRICLDVSEAAPVKNYNVSDFERLMLLVNQIWNEYNSEDQYKHEAILANVTLLCINFLRNTDQNEEVSKPDFSSLYIDFRRTLKSNFKEYRKVKDYVAALNTTEKKLNEIVMKKTGKSVSVLIFDQLILESKRLLNSGCSVKETAYELNFSDPAHFSKFFKKHTNISPKDFQELHD